MDFMEIPNWMKPALFGAGAGAAALAIVGFGWGGWITGAKASVMVSKEAQEQVLAALLPICVSNAGSDTTATDKIAELKAANSYKRAEILGETGWATMPGSDKPNTALARLCAVELIQ